MRTADPILHQQRRNEILRAAELCFTAKGFHQASMNEIAKAAGVSMGLLYRYFKNKAEIVISFSARDRDETLEAIRYLSDAPEPLQALKVLMSKNIVALTTTDAARLSCEVMAEAGRNKIVLEAIKSDSNAMTRALEHAFKLQQQAGRIAKTTSPAALAELTLALLDGCVGRAMSDANFDPKRYTTRVSLVLNSLLAPDRSSKSPKKRSKK